MATAADTELEHLDRLIWALERAEGTFRFGSTEQSDDALAESLAALGDLYGALDPISSPEVAMHMNATYDACVRGLGDAYGGSFDALVAATAMVRSVRSALAPREPRQSGIRRAA